MKILLAPSGSRGDVYPVIYLGRELKKRGHLVRVATSPDYKEICELEGFEFCPTGTNFRVLMDSFVDCMGKPLKVMVEGLKIFNKELNDFFNVTFDASEEIDFIVASGLQMTGPTVAELKNIPYRYMAHIPILIPSKYHSPYFVTIQNLPKWMNKILWSANNFFLRISIAKTLNEIRLKNSLNLKRDVIDHVEPKRMVVAVSPELGPIAPDNSHIGIQTDYFFDTEEAELSEEMQCFLDDGDAPIYFGFGSMIDGKSKKTLEVIFKTIEKLGERAVISRGWANYNHDDVPKGIIFAGNEPHGKLFPKMKVIVHHGGAGTTSSAARAGIPQVTTPHVLDQYYWTNRIKSLGIGPGGIKKRKFNVKNLTKIISQALNSSDIKQKAKLLGEALSDRNGVMQLADEIEKELNCFN